jgi:glycosyltransferase involved in cell wall biosynthesis
MIMKILLIEPYFTGSHQMWAEDYQHFSQHDIELITLPGRHWKWRMHGGAIELADSVNKKLKCGYQPDLIFISDMVDLSTFKALLDMHIPIALYFHENQLSYPYSNQDTDSKRTRDFHYGFMNYTSALVADRVFFNSKAQMDAFFQALQSLLKVMPDFKGLEKIPSLKEKTSVLPLGIRLEKNEARSERETSTPPLVLWTHRWEYDKNPEAFFKALYSLSDQGIDFNVAILGASGKKPPDIFKEAREKLGTRVVAFDKPKTRESYLKWLGKGRILPVTSYHETFGISMIEAVYNGVTPLLPNRLSYPEIIPPKDFPDLYYEDHTELVNKIKRLLSDTHYSPNPALQTLVSKYDWSCIGPLYDHILESIVQ